MDAPTIPVSAEENLGDPIDIRVDIIHPEPVLQLIFLRRPVDITEAENASLRARIKTSEAIEKITCNRERQESKFVTDALNRKERIKPLRIQALVMTICLDLPKQILNAQTEA
ncbi:hypothetical protein Tco_0733368 [Tanacetum coccineum]